MTLKRILALLLIGIIMISCGKSQTKIEYAGVDISDKIEILRDKNSKTASLRVEMNEEWALYRGNSVDSISYKNLVMRGPGGGVYPLDIPLDHRSYFLFVTKESKAILAEKHLPMSGGFNFRDMGGIKNKDGRFVKWGKVFRADDLSLLTGEDLLYLAAIPIATVVDFRSKSEIEEAPDRLPNTVNKHLLLSIDPGSLNTSGLAGMKEMVEKEGADEVMKKMNRSFSTDSTYIAQYRQFFDALQNDSDIPLLFHCTAGKDRTGMGAALFLLSLGVDEDIVFQDYMLSNIYLEPKYGAMKAKYPEMGAMFTVKKEFLRAGLDEIIKNYGSVENYLKNMLNVDLNKMQNKFLY